MSDFHLCRDGIRERQLESRGVQAHVHSDGQYVTVTMDTWMFEYLRKKLGSVWTGSVPSTPSHIMRNVTVTLSVE